MENKAANLPTISNEIEMPFYDPAVPPLGIYPKELKTESRRDICTPLFTAAVFAIARR